MKKENRENLDNGKLTTRKVMKEETAREFATLGEYRDALKAYYRDAQHDDKKN